MHANCITPLESFSSHLITLMVLAYHLASFSLNHTILPLSHITLPKRRQSAISKGCRSAALEQHELCTTTVEHAAVSLLPPSVGGPSASQWRTPTTSSRRQPPPPGMQREVRHHQAQGTVCRLQPLKVCCLKHEEAIDNKLTEACGERRIPCGSSPLPH
jgi:hypothetical protein